MEDLREAIDLEVENRLETMSDDVRKHIRLAQYSLMHGPVYLDEDGDPCSCFDEGMTPHNFTESCEIIRSYVDAIEDLRDELVCEEDECVYEEIPIEGTAREIAKRIVGAELLPYVL